MTNIYILKKRLRSLSKMKSRFIKLRKPTRRIEEMQLNIREKINKLRALKKK